MPGNMKLKSLTHTTLGEATTVRITEDGLLCAVDLVIALTGKDRNQAGRYSGICTKITLTPINSLRDNYPHEVVQKPNS
jgi:hypothetical protein